MSDIILTTTTINDAVHTTNTCIGRPFSVPHSPQIIVCCMCCTGTMRPAANSI